MKIFKPLMFAVAGFAIAFLVSFKNEEPKKEYATLYYDEVIKKNAIKITMNSEIKNISSEVYRDESLFIKTLNDFCTNGWKVVSTDCYPQSNSGSYRIIYLERPKP